MISIVFGTMTIGEQVFDDDVKNMLKAAMSLGITELDTAYVYNEGRCESLIGDALQILREAFAFEVSTKVNPRVSGRLDANAVYSQFSESIRRMRVPTAKTLYLHFPDADTPLESALEACNDLHCKGKIKELGFSNFPSWLVEEAYYKCKTNGWITPSVYEGLYNPLSRRAEKELFPALRSLGMRFYAYNPLAGGMLTNKYGSISDSDSIGRFTYRQNYKSRYWKESFFKGREIILRACDGAGLSIVEATFGFLAHHSALRSDTDAIIIGASKAGQVKQNVEAIRGGVLPNVVVDAFKEAWDITKVDAPEYFRFYRSGGFE